MLRTLQNDGTRYWTGLLDDGKQLIIGPSLPNILVYTFDQSGKFAAKEVIPLDPKPTFDESEHAYVTDTTFITTMESQITSILQKMGCSLQTVQVEEFYDDVDDIGVKELPAEYDEYLDEADRFSAEDCEYFERAIKEWREAHRFVFVWGIELWISMDGERLTS